jgi:hypothetical protein
MYSCHGDSNVKVLTNSSGTCDGFSARNASGKVVQHVVFDRLDFAASGYLYATADGHTVVYLARSPEPVETTPGVVVFRDGKVAARYTAKELLVRPDLVTHSVSHIRWLVKEPSEGPLGKVFTLTTTSWRQVRIDLATGKLAADDAPEWKKCDVIAYAGRGMHVTGETATIDEPAIAKGNVKGALTFKTARGVALADGDSGVTVCLTGSARGWLAVDKLDVMYNALPSR